MPHIVYCLNTARSSYEGIVESGNPKAALCAALVMLATIQLTAVFSAGNILFAALNLSYAYYVFSKHEASRPIVM